MIIILSIPLQAAQLIQRSGADPVIWTSTELTRTTSAANFRLYKDGNRGDDDAVFVEERRGDWPGFNEDRGEDDVAFVEEHRGEWCEFNEANRGEDDVAFVEERRGE
ncbi:unnamed protein product [Didymodactylos carnosus]|uniref:Uncharacterized protein n=1 Tax=Didymodactylos carnosus TaxID=1234261 RepID=A0A8S2HLL3_9BILA|nr:unnamed protein product [Didymodactylos carnosus]CAF3663154.1 unnamed protein product [Didymodactylos carnosus]